MSVMISINTAPDIFKEFANSNTFTLILFHQCKTQGSWHQKDVEQENLDFFPSSTDIKEIESFHLLYGKLCLDKK